jgi:hypothetical protein
MIEKLPLDVFGDDEAATPPDPVTEGNAAIVGEPLPAGDDAPTDGGGHVDAAATRPAVATEPSARLLRVYDAIGVFGLSAGLGVLMRAIGLSAALPVVNIVVAIVVYSRLPRHTRDAYRATMDNLKRRWLDPATADLASRPLPPMSSGQRWLYDGIGVALLAIGGWLALGLLGFDSWFRSPWLALAIAAGAYFWWGRRWRHEYYTLAEQFRGRLAGARPK